MLIYLYVKQHSITKLKYFGKTTSKNPFKYLGSGLHWKRHYQKYGSSGVQTIEVWGFDDNQLCTEFALKFSRENDIVHSDEWANLKEENGFDGGWSPYLNTGFKYSEESKRKMSEGQKARGGNGPRKHSEETKRKMSEKRKGRKPSLGSKWTEEQKLKQSILLKSRWNNQYMKGVN